MPQYRYLHRYRYLYELHGRCRAGWQRSAGGGDGRASNIIIMGHGRCDGLRLYVYERTLAPPPCGSQAGSNYTFSLMDGQCRCLPMSSSLVPKDGQAAFCSLRGPHLQLDRAVDTTGSAFSAAHPMALAHVVHHRALAHQCRVTNPALAEVFLVPLYTLMKANGGGDDRGPCIVQQNALSSWRADVVDEHKRPYMDRHAGADHVVVASLSMWPAESCAATFGRASKLGAALRIGVDGGPSFKGWKARALAYDYAAEDHYLTVPGVGAASVRGFRPPTSHPRRHLAALCALSCCHGNHRQALALRQLLRRACAAGSERNASSGAGTQCALGVPGRHYSLSATDPSYRAATITLYSRATFCLMPSGDWPSRVPAMVDAMATGCIPVLFHPEQLRLWPSHVPDWDAIAVYVHFEAVLNGSVDVLTVLDTLPDAEVRRRREGLHRLMPKLVYAPAAGAEGEGHDAFDILLGAAARHARRWRGQV